MKYTSYGAVAALTIFSFVPRAAFAHCPLCTAGAVAIGFGAYELGMPTFSVGIGAGAFALALGLWFVKIVQRQYIPLQRPIIVGVIFASTILPMLPFMPGAFGLYLPSVGVYGFTLTASRFLLGSLLGAAVLCAAPGISRALTRATNKHVMFQGMLVTILLLLAAIALSALIL